MTDSRKPSTAGPKEKPYVPIEHRPLLGVSEAAALTILGLPLDYARNMIDKSQAIDAKTLQELARKYLQTDKAYMVVVKP